MSLFQANSFSHPIGHVNNIMYNKYAETGRVKFIHNQSEDATDEEKSQWLDLPTPRGLGLILRSITTEYKFVCLRDSHIFPN
jgi:acyl-CoA thioesterase FadM